MVSRVRVPVSPLTKLLQKWGKSVRVGDRPGPYYTNQYTNALFQGVFYRTGRLVAHAWQDVGVGVEGDGYVGVTQKFLNYLGMDASDKEQRGARVTQVVKAGLIRQPGALEGGLKERLLRL